MAPDSSSVGPFLSESYVKYSMVNFEPGEAKVFMAVYSAEQRGELELRLDAPDGMKIGTVVLESTGNAALFKECYTVIDEVTGVHDIYLVAPQKTSAYLDTIVFSTNNGSETESETDARMAWWRSARYGQFIHFGAYANYEFKDTYSGYSEWVMSHHKISREEYERSCVETFNPIDWNADKIVSDAIDSGVQYIVFTSKHHEGFSMFNTNVSGFKSFSLTGYGTYKGEDPLGTLAAACKAADIPFGCYYSIMDWRHEAQNQWGSEILEKEAYIADMKAQLRELIQKYDVDILWFDGEWVEWWTKEDGDDLYRYLRTLKPSLIINNRVGNKLITMLSLSKAVS